MNRLQAQQFLNQEPKPPQQIQEPPQRYKYSMILRELFYYDKETMEPAEDDRYEPQYDKSVVDLDDNQADPRLFEEKMLAKIESILLGKADADVSSYSIAGRSLTKYSYQELQDLHDQYEAKVNRHKQLERIKLGKTTHHTVKVRFS